MKPLGLSDSQYDAVVRACEPLAPADRSRFLVELAERARARRRRPRAGDSARDQAVL